MNITLEKWNEFVTFEVGPDEYVRVTLNEINELLEEIEYENKEKENNIGNDQKSGGSRASFFPKRNLRGETARQRQKTPKNREGDSWKTNRPY